MTTMALQVIQPALYNKLTSDGVLMGMITGVYDAPPQNAVMPYVTIGAGTANTLSQLVSQISECQLELRVWTAGAGRKTALAVLNRLHGLLHQGSLTLSGLTLMSMQCTQAETAIDPANDRTEGTLQLVITVTDQ